MINMKDLIKKQTDMIRKESGMNITEATSKPEIGDYFEDGRMVFGQIVNIDTWKGTKLVYVKPISGQLGKAVATIQYDYKKIKEHGMQHKGKTVWIPK